LRVVETWIDGGCLRFSLIQRLNAAADAWLSAERGLQQFRAHLTVTRRLVSNRVVV